MAIYENVDQVLDMAEREGLQAFRLDYENGSHTYILAENRDDANYVAMHGLMMVRRVSRVVREN